MYQTTIPFINDTYRLHVVNHGVTGNYSATIQNNTDKQIRVKVSNCEFENTNAFTDTAGGELVIEPETMGLLDEPYQRWMLFIGVPANGTVDITEKG